MSLPPPFQRHDHSAVMSTNHFLSNVHGIQRTCAAQWPKRPAVGLTHTHTSTSLQLGHEERITSRLPMR